MIGLGISGEGKCLLHFYFNILYVLTKYLTTLQHPTFAENCPLPSHLHLCKDIPTFVKCILIYLNFYKKSVPLYPNFYKNRS